MPRLEAATAPAVEAGIRVANLHLGMVLGGDGGALGKMLFPFRMGVRGIIGNGRQFWSWVAIEDAIGAIQHTLSTEWARGPINVVSPNAVTNREFTKTLGACVEASDRVSDAGIGGESGFRRDGGRFAARQRAGAADPSGGQRLPVSFSRPRNDVTAAGIEINRGKTRYFG